MGIFQTDLDAPLGRIIAIDLREPQREHWREVVAEGTDTLERTRLIGGRLLGGAGVHAARLTDFRLESGLPVWQFQVGDAVVEIWQADADGSYVAPMSPNSNSVPSFTGWGRQPTNGDGVYRFETIKPGPVAGPDGKPMTVPVAEAAAGLVPMASSRVVEVTP